MSPINEHLVFASMLFCGMLVVVSRGLQGEWITFQMGEGLLLVFLLLAILSTFAPQLAGGLSFLVLVVMTLRLAPKMLNKL